MSHHAPNHSHFRPPDSAISFKPGWLVSSAVRHVSLGIAPALSHRAGSKLRADMSREDDQHWVSASAQSEAPADTRRSRGAPGQGSSAHAVISVAGSRSKREWKQFGPSIDVPASVAAKKEGVGNERTQPVAPAAGSRSKEEWEQPSLTLVVPGNVAVKNDGSCNKRPVGGVRRRTTSQGCGEQHGSEVSTCAQTRQRDGQHVLQRQSLGAPEGFRVATAAWHQTLRGSSDSGLG